MRILTKPAATLLIIGILAAASPVGADESEERRSFTLAAAGDVIVHITMAAEAEQHAPGWNTYDFSPLVTDIEPWISEADLAICHMEMTLSPTNTGLSYWPLFVVPHELAEAVAGLGFDACTTASNHSLDAGLQGLSDTLDLLHAAGIRTTGTARSEEERLPNLYQVNGVTVGHMDYTYGLNGWHAVEPWSVNIIDTEEILADAAWLREQGAEFTILSVHWGNEYRVPPSIQQTTLAEELLASPDIDLILGHHVHVVQPIARFGEEWVVYGMSNLMANINTNAAKGRFGTENGIIVNAEVVEQADGRFLVERLEYTPIRVDTRTKRVIPVGHALATGTGDSAVLRTSWEQTIARVNYLGDSPATPTVDPWPPLACNGRVATILGTPGDDVLVGTDGDDVIVARDGNDSIWAGGGDDLVCGGDGNDFISGGSGNDRLQGEGGDDVAMGYAGEDEVWGGEGGDVLSGGDGDDLLIGGTGDDSLRGGAGSDDLWGGAGDDRSDAGPDDRCVAARCS